MEKKLFPSKTEVEFGARLFPARRKKLMEDFFGDFELKLLIQKGSSLIWRFSRIDWSKTRSSVVSAWKYFVNSAYLSIVILSVSSVSFCQIFTDQNVQKRWFWNLSKNFTAIWWYYYWFVYQPEWKNSQCSSQLSRMAKTQQNGAKTVSR